MAICVFCGSFDGISISCDKGICKTCSNKLMGELLKTQKWKDIYQAIVNALMGHSW